MRGWLFWGVATAALAMIVHLSVVLFAPMIDVGRRMAAFETAAPVNSLKPIQSASSESSILVEPSPDISYAFCRFDVSDSALRISAPIPDSYWSLSIYSDAGENLYTINDAQTGVRQLHLLVTNAESSEAGAGAIPDGPKESIRFASPVPRGLVLIRSFIPERSLRAIIDATVASARCTSMAN